MQWAGEPATVQRIFRPRQPLRDRLRGLRETTSVGSGERAFPRKDEEKWGWLAEVIWEK
jgi:hypothetical protein